MAQKRGLFRWEAELLLRFVIGPASLDQFARHSEPSIRKRSPVLLLSRLSYKVSLTRLHSTLLPQTSGRRTWAAVGWTASQEFHPRQDLCRPPSLLDPLNGGWDWTGVSPWQVLLRNSLPQAVFRTDVTALHLRWPYLIKAEEFTAILPRLQVVLAHPPASLASFKRPCQERIQVFGCEVFKEHGRPKNDPLTV